YSADIVHSSYMAIDHMPAGAIFIFFVLVFLVNTLLNRVKPAWAFSAGELLLVYTMMLVASSVTEMGFGSQILPMIAAPYYYGSAENRWDEFIFPHLKKTLVPQDQAAIKYFFEGLPKGQAIPWKAWLGPLSLWLPFIFVLYFVMICVVVILRKQWMEREKLVYPLTILPAEMVKPVEDKKKRYVPAFFKNPLMWLGFGIAFLIGSLTALHNYIELIPAVKLDQSIPIFRRTSTLVFRTSFPVMGFVYFVNLEVSFSLWFFNLLFKVVRGVFNITGITSTENVGIYGCAGDPISAHLGMGAMIVMVFYALWLSRSHLRTVWEGALGHPVDDQREILSYKQAFWGMVLGFIFMVFWLVYSGMSWLVAVSFLVIAFVIWLVLTRVVCEGGVPTMVATTIASTQVISAFGSKNLLPATLVALGLTYVYSSDLRTFPIASSAMGLKITEPATENRRLIFWAIMGAIVINIVATLWLQLRLAYKYGGINLAGWYFIGGPQAPYKYITDHLRNPTGPNGIGWLCRGLGAVLMGVLMFLRQRFLWWPLHPIGFVIGPVWLLDQLWFSIFVVWLIKKLILRYGGVQVYEKLKYFFLGLPLGLYTCAGLWFVIDLFTGKKGNSIFWI
ncbi:MAG TPA: hypothetical protein PKW42_06655, partial [bacterium]|nr:hypothetical protein [bacterium]